MLYVYALIVIIIGVYLSFAGQQKIRFAMGVSYFISSTIMYLTLCHPNYAVDILPNFPYLWPTITINLIIALCVVFSQSFLYMIAWEVLALPTLLIYIKIFNGFHPYQSLLILVVPGTLVFLMRHVVDKIAAGLLSGFCLSFGVLLFTFHNQFESGEIMTEQSNYIFMVIAFSFLLGISLRFFPIAIPLPNQKK